MTKSHNIVKGKEGKDAEEEETKVTSFLFPISVWTNCPHSTAKPPTKVSNQGLAQDLTILI
jgi:hypothetical protein